jgi:hypothetical protein
VKKGNALLSLLFNLALAYDIRNVQEIKEGLELNGINQFLVSADDINMLDKNTNTIKKNIEALLEVGREVSLEVSMEKTKYDSNQKFPD